jgi:hypothetical protein
MSSFGLWLSLTGQLFIIGLAIMALRMMVRVIRGDF